MPRIVIHEPDAQHDSCYALLTHETEDVVVCRNQESLIRALSSRKPDVLIYVLGDIDRDLGFLRQLRGAAPTLPIILLGGPTDLKARRTIQELRPTYFGVFPLEDSELNEAVLGVLHRGSPHP